MLSRNKYMVLKSETTSEKPAAGGDVNAQVAPVSSGHGNNGNGGKPASAIPEETRRSKNTSVLDQVKWEEVYPEAEAILRKLIRFQTVNPPGNERPAARYLADLLRQDGLEPELFEAAPARTNLICRLKGTGEKPPLQLDGHLDVVSADEDYWAHPPFAADVADGYIWGRGALDMKQMVTMSLMCLLLFKRMGARFKRDIIYTAVADEEMGGAYGAKHLVDNHADRIRAEYCLGEIGGFSINTMKRTFYPVQVAEKGLCWFELIARGNAGHGAIPEPEAPLIRLSEAILKLTRKGLPQHNTAVVEQAISTLSANQSFPNNLLPGLLLHPWLSDLLLDKAVPDKDIAAIFSSMLHNTVNPTVIHAGDKTNIVPSVARVEVDGRILPGQTRESFLAEVKDLVGPDFEINVLAELKPTTADPNDPIIGLMSQVLRRHDPSAVVIPTMIPATTNATHYSRLGTKYFGFSPMKSNNGDSFKAMFHGHNERISVDGFRFGVRVLAELVEKICA